MQLEKASDTYVKDGERRTKVKRRDLRKITDLTFV